MGTIEQLISDIREWMGLLMDHAETPSHLPPAQEAGPWPGSGRVGGQVGDGHPRQAA
jgi:hypothetical protein